MASKRKWGDTASDEPLQPLPANAVGGQRLALKSRKRRRRSVSESDQLLLDPNSGLQCTAPENEDDQHAASIGAVAMQSTAAIGDAQQKMGTRMAVLVPFRANHAAQKRRAHLDAFVPYMTTFLQRHCEPTRTSFHIFIVEQSLDGRKFNRGKLLNAGFDMARDDFDVFIFHDVDLLPGDDLGELYAHVPRLGPMHIARVWGRYNENPHYFGGIVAFTRQQFVKINGFPNNFWGWGGEDNELYSRVVRKKLTVQAPIGGTIRDLEELDLEEKLAVLRASKWKCTVKRELLKEHHRTWKTNGLKSLYYEYVDAESLNDCCTKITVHLGPNGHWSDARSSLERPKIPTEVSSSPQPQTDRSQASEANGSVDQGHGEEKRAPQDASSSDETHEEALAIQ